MSGYVLASAPSWYCSRVSDCSEQGLFVYGARHSLYILDVSVCPPSFRGIIDQAHRERVTAVTCCHGQAKGIQCCTAGEDGKLKIWDLESKCMLDEHTCPQVKLTTVHWSPIDRDLIVSGDDKGNLTCWRPGKAQAQQVSPESLHIFCLTCSPHDPSLVAIGYKSGLIVVVDIERQGCIINRLRGHDEEIHCLSWCPVLGEDIKQAKEEDKEDGDDEEGCLLISGSRDRTIRVWSTIRSKCLQVLKLPANTGARRDRFEDQNRTRVWLTLYWPKDSPRQFVSSTAGGDLLLWDLTKTGKQKWLPFQTTDQARGHIRIVFNIVAGGKDWDTLCTISMDRQVALWSLSTTTCQQVIPTLGGFVYSLAQNQLNPALMAVGVGDNMVRIWNLANPSNPYETTTLWQGIKAKVMALSWHPTKEGWLGYATDDGRVGIYDILSNKAPMVSNTYHRGTVYVVAWGPPCVAQEKGGSNAVYNLYSCGDGIILQHNPHSLDDDATNINSLIKQTNNTQQKFPIRSEISWKHDFSLVAIGNDDGSIEIYKPANLRLLCTVHVHRKLINCIRWHPPFTADSTEVSPNQFWLASGSNHSTIHVVNLENVLGGASSEKADSGAKVVTESFCQLDGHTSRITGLCWSPHQQGQLVSASYDATAQVWDVQSGTAVANFRGHNGRLLCVQWSAQDPDLIYTGGDDNTVLPWHISQQTHTCPPKASEKKAIKQKLKAKSRSKPREIPHLQAESRSPSASPDPGAGGEGGIEALQELLEQKKQELLRKEQEQSMLGYAGSSETGQAEALESHAQVNATSKEAATPESNEQVSEANMERVREILGPSHRLRYTEPDQPRPEPFAAKKGTDGKDKKRKRVKSLFPVMGMKENLGKASAQQDCIDLAKILPESSGTKPVELTPEQQHLSFYVPGRRNINALIKEEVAYHVERGNIEQYQQLELWKGNIGGLLRAAAQAGQLDDGLMSLAPMASPELWQELCVKYAEQLEQEGNYHKASTYLLAAHQVYRAISMLSKHNLYKEAMCLAKLRLSSQDPVISQVCGSWAIQLSRDGNFERAAKCYLSSGQYAQAAKVLAKRADPTGLKTAAIVALAKADKTPGQISELPMAPCTEDSAENRDENRADNSDEGEGDAGDRVLGMVFGQQYIQDCQLRGDWVAAMDMVHAHPCFEALSCEVITHEIIVKELLNMGVLDQQLFPDPKFYLQDQPRELHQSAKMKLHGLMPWRPRLFQDGCMFPEKLILSWEQNKDPMLLILPVLQQMKKARQKNTALKQVLVQVAVDLSIGTILLYNCGSEKYFECVLEVVGHCYQLGHDVLAEGIMRLVLPYGPLSVDGAQAAKVAANQDRVKPGQGKNLPDSQDEKASTEEQKLHTNCQYPTSVYDCLKAYYFFGVIKFWEKKLLARASNQNKSKENSSTSVGESRKGTLVRSKATADGSMKQDSYVTENGKEIPCSVTETTETSGNAGFNEEMAVEELVLRPKEMDYVVKRLLNDDLCKKFQLQGIVCEIQKATLAMVAKHKAKGKQGVVPVNSADTETSEEAISPALQGENDNSGNRDSVNVTVATGPMEQQATVGTNSVTGETDTSLDISTNAVLMSQSSILQTEIYTKAHSIFTDINQTDQNLNGFGVPEMTENGKVQEQVDKSRADAATCGTEEKSSIPNKGLPASDGTQTGSTMGDTEDAVSNGVSDWDQLPIYEKLQDNRLTLKLLTEEQCRVLRDMEQLPEEIKNVAFYPEPVESGKSLVRVCQLYSPYRSHDWSVLQRDIATLGLKYSYTAQQAAVFGEAVNSTLTDV